MIGLAKGFGGEACPNDRWSLTSTLLFFSQKETLVYRGIRPAELSYIFSYVADKAIADHVQISGYFVYSFIYTRIVFVLVTGIIFNKKLCF
jgi:hypothetical protein